MNRLLGDPPDQITEQEKARLIKEIEDKKTTLCDNKCEYTDSGEFLKQINALTGEEFILNQKYPDLPPENPIIVTDVKRECGGCPTSWSGDYNGKEVYARYRGGYLSVTLIDTDGGESQQIFGKQLDSDERTEDQVRAQAENDYDNDERVQSVVDTWRLMKEFNGGIISFDGYLTYDELKEATKGWFIWT